MRYSTARRPSTWAPWRPCWALGEGDRIPLLASPSFDVSLDEIVPTLLSGACLAVGGSDLWQPAALLLAARRFRFTVVNLAAANWKVGCRRAVGSRHPATSHCAW